MESLWLPRMAYSFRPLSAFLLTLMINIGVGYAQQKVCPGQVVTHSSYQPNSNTTYRIEFFVENGEIVGVNFPSSNASYNSTYADFSNWCGGYDGAWDCLPTINVRWDNNGQQGKVKVKYTWSWWGVASSSSTDEYLINIGTPAPTYVWIDSPDPNAIPCSRNSFVVYTDNYSAWNAQYSWTGSNVQLSSNNGSNAVFSINPNTQNGSVNVQVTNSQCPSVNFNFSKSYTRTPANPTISGLSIVRPGTTEIYQVDGSGYQSYYWSVPSDWQLIEEYNGQARIRAGDMENMDGDIYFTYTDACGYSGQASKYVNTSYSGGRVAATSIAQEIVDISVSPNPVEHQLNVKIPGQGSAKVSLINAGGKEYISKEVEVGNWQYNARLLPAGLYILNVKTGDKSFSKKLLKID
ncbi:hypothetical protein BH09BAC4_BH09BAC4_47110 [soil metagenome]